jgi:eukaryotic-like serine/threonine-protein kinase
MTPYLRSLPVLSHAEEIALLEFEGSWETGIQPDFRTAVSPGAGVDFLIELVHIDLERRVRAHLAVDVEAYLAAFPLLATRLGIRRDLLSTEDALRQRLEPVNMVTGSGGSSDSDLARSGTASSRCISPVVPGYRLVRVVGTGGMSVVYEAIDCRSYDGTNRGNRVAIKLIKAGVLATEEARQRFRQEVHVLSRLRHVNVVDLLDAGTTPDGHDYLVMEYLAGGPLADTVCSAEEAAHLIETLSRAVGFFHRHKIVHRDLKPSNVLRADDGSTLKIADFGLAKCIEPGTGTTTEAVGTPLYMPPEQVFPRLAAKVGPASDVYALGVLLYRVLTGVYPVPGLTPETLGRLRFEDPIPVRRHNPAVPRALETICAKSLERQPSRRYANGDELADDLARYRRQQRIAARPVSLLGHWSRRAERNPVLAFTVALLITTLLTAAGAGIYGAWKYTADLRAAKQVADRSQQRARDALDLMSSLFIEDWLAKQPRLEPSQQAFLDRALASYEALVAEVDHTEESRKSAADAYLRIGKIHMLLGQFAKAASAYQKADDQFQSLVDDFPHVARYRADLAASYQETAKVLVARGNPEQAAAVYREALNVLEALAAEFPDNPIYQSQTVAILRGLGTALQRLGRITEAEAVYVRALVIQEKAVTESPTVPEYRLELAKIWNNLGFALQPTKEVARAEAAYRKALELKKELTAQFPDNAQYRMTYARTLGNFANLLRDKRRRSDAKGAYEETLEIQKRLVADFPTVHEYRQELAGTYLTLGPLLIDMGLTADAETAYQSALALQIQILAEDSSVTMSHLELARIYRNMAILYARTDRAKDAKSVYQQALAEYEALAARFPTELEHQAELAETLHRFAELVREQHDFSLARSLMEQAGSRFEVAISLSSRNAEVRRFYCDNRSALSTILLETGEHVGAAVAAGNLAASALDPIKDRYLAACLLAQCMRQAQGDSRLGPARRDELIESYARQAIEILGEAVGQGYDDAAQLRMESKLEPLRSREDFRTLLAKVEGRTRSFGRNSK